MFIAELSHPMFRYKMPRHMFFVASYPLTASGKIQKYRLREQSARLPAGGGGTAAGGEPEGSC